MNKRILAYHLVAAMLQSTGVAVLTLMPVIARLRFNAGDWQTTLITAAGPTLLISSIFWNALLARTSARQYLAIHWLTAILPVALIGLATQYWHLLAWHLVGAVGLAGWNPLNGRLMNRFYADRLRGRAFGLVSVATQLGSMATAYVAGAWLKRDGEAFRVILPACAVLQGAGLVILAILTRSHGQPTARAAAPTRLSDLLAPVVHMNRILRADAVFRRYEQAFMTYGVGWMIGNALLPVLVTTGLHLNYEQIAVTTVVAYQIALTLMVIPMGWLIDRVGAARTSAISFAGLALYPLGLLVSGDPLTLAAVSGFYGVAMAGVQQGWLIGPVTLAPSAERVADYVAVHTTLVGIRGTLAQALGMWLYRATGGFFWPLIIASVAFAWAAWQMRSLHAFMSSGPKPRSVDESRAQSAELVVTGSGPPP
ncbi:MAG: MFS transporter [Phycisphaerae bacterium]